MPVVQPAARAMRTMVACSKPCCATTRQAMSAISSRRFSWSTIFGIASARPRLDRSQARADFRVHRCDSAFLRADVQIEQLRGGDDPLVARAMQRVQHAHALLIHLEHAAL